jgi:prolipoprotein diacylglyceryltransferase
MIFRMITEPFLGDFITLYAILFSATAAGGLLLSIWLYRGEKLLLLNAGLGVLFFSLMGARIGFVLRNLSFFIINPLEIAQLWLGGLSWPGAIFGGVIALVVIHLIWKESLGELADHLLPLFGLLVVAAWLTSWGAGLGYGPVTDAWFALPVYDRLGLLTWRWPLPILGALFSGLWITGAILVPLKKTHKPGSRALLAMAGTAGINLVISIFKVDPAPIFLGLRWESWFSILFLGVSAIFFFFFRMTNLHE